jgi:hypothetical protein
VWLVPLLALARITKINSNKWQMGPCSLQEGVPEKRHTEVVKLTHYRTFPASRTNQFIRVYVQMFWTWFLCSADLLNNFVISNNPEGDAVAGTRGSPLWHFVELVLGIEGSDFRARWPVRSLSFEHTRPAPSLPLSLSCCMDTLTIFWHVVLYFCWVI